MFVPLLLLLTLLLHTRHKVQTETSNIADDVMARLFGQRETLESAQQNVRHEIPSRFGREYSVLCAVCVAGSWDVETRRRSAPNCRQVERAAVHIESRRSLMLDERGCRGLRGLGGRRAAATCSCFT